VSILTLSVLGRIVAMHRRWPAIKIRPVSDDAHRPPVPNGIPVPDVAPALNAPGDPPGERDTTQPSAAHDQADASAGFASWLVRAPNLAGVRRHILDTAVLAGLDTGQADKFILAVNEIMINAIRHAGGQASVEVSATKPTDDRDGDVTVTVTDTGPGFNHSNTPALPPADQLHGRGLWLARQTCDDIVISSSPQGTVVRLRATTRRE
jgi:anti-sigma regulatory factor (Ser/Thr protein kinase)